VWNESTFSSLTRPFALDDDSLHLSSNCVADRTQPLKSLFTGDPFIWIASIHEIVHLGLGEKLGTHHSSHEPHQPSLLCSPLTQHSSPRFFHQSLEATLDYQFNIYTSHINTKFTITEASKIKPQSCHRISRCHHINLSARAAVPRLHILIYTSCRVHLPWHISHRSTRHCILGTPRTAHRLEVCQPAPVHGPISDWHCQ
jgi:hypothetical protein